MSPCSGWFAAVVAAGVAEIAMIDQEPVAGTGAGQAHAAAGERRQARGAQEPEPRRGVLAIAADRVDVQVEPLSAAGRRELRDHLLVRLPAGFRLMALHHPGQLGASLVVDLHARLVAQVAPDAGKVERGLYPDGGQFAGRPDAGPKQDRGAPVGASADDDPRRADLYQLLIIPHGHADSAAVADEHPLDQGIAGHNEPVADRIDIPERAVDTGSPVDVDREGGDSSVLAQVIEVLHHRDPVSRDRVHAGALERGQLIEAHAPHPQLLPRRGEQRPELPRRPAGVPRGGPAVVIEAAIGSQTLSTGCDQQAA